MNKQILIALALLSSTATLAHANSDVPDNMLSAEAAALPLCSEGPWAPAVVKSGQSCQLPLQPNMSYGIQMDITKERPIVVSLSGNCEGEYRSGMTFEKQREYPIYLYQAISLSNMRGDYQFRSSRSVSSDGSCSLVFEAK